jgi:translation initiation factor 4E
MLFKVSATVFKTFPLSLPFVMLFIYLLKKDIPPMWEDPQNRDGGRWVLSLDKKNRAQSLDIYWLNCLLALVGDQFCDQSAYINGIWVNVRMKGDKISLWTRDSKDAESQMSIG